MKSLQETYAPRHICFGCGPANSRGLRIRSFPRQDGTVAATFEPGREHQAFPEVICGGIIGTLLDCHSSWAAAWHMGDSGRGGFLPCTVTAAYSIRLIRPMPCRPLEVIAAVKTVVIGRAIVTGSISVDGETYATSEGTFVAVDESTHPAFGRWTGA